MNWQKQMQEVMTYIEENLAGTIEYSRIAKIMKCSEGEFRRMFSFLSDIPLSDYIRNRRLTGAVEDIRQGMSISNVGHKYGYESQAAFSRAFKNFHGIAPKMAKDPKTPVNVCYPLTLKLVVMEGKTVKENNHSRTNIIGGGGRGRAKSTSMTSQEVQSVNTNFWDNGGSEILGCTALPSYGAFNCEENHGLFGSLENKRVLEIACGSGQSLAYVGKAGANDLWGLDISRDQLIKTQKLLNENRLNANLVCGPMEDDTGLPSNYFDLVYSIYGIGWTTDLLGTFKRIHTYLKKDGIFIFSWSHPIHKCVTYEEGDLNFKKCYFDESQYVVQLGNENLSLSDRKMSTYVNALAQSGFIIEEMIEESDSDMLAGKNSPFAEKAKMLPVTFVIKARKI